MATIGKDGKDDAARMAALGGSQMMLSISSISGGSVPKARFNRVEYTLTAPPSIDIIRAHVDLLERLTLVGFVDSYGASDPLNPFAVFQADEKEALALAQASSLVTQAGASTAVKGLDLSVSVWK